MIVHALALLPLVLQDPPAPAPQDAAPRLELPAGALADAVALLRADAPPSPALAPEGRALFVSGALDTTATWDAWGADLVALGGGDEARRGAARARLALVALEQERPDDAWDHLAALRGDDAALAALLPRFLPGVPAGAPVGAGGHAGALPDGVELRPALPYEPRREGSGAWAPRAAKLDGLVVGKARVGLEIAVEGEGVQVTVRHQGGEAANLKLRIPRHPEYAIEAEFVDWWQQDALGEAWELELVPGGEEHVLYGRFKGGIAARTKLVPKSVPSQLALHGMVVLVEPGCAERDALASFAKAVGAACGIAAEIVETRPEPSAARAPLLVDWSDPQARRADWPHLAGRIERFVLR